MIISIVIPTHNRKNSVERLLNNIRVQEIGPDVTLITLLVIDGSTDGTIEMVMEKFPEITIVYGSGNWWVTKSLNEGIKKAYLFNSDYVLTLNDDLSIKKGYIQSLISNVDLVPVNSIIGSISLTSDNPVRIFFSGVKRTNFHTYSSSQYYPFLEEVDQEKLHGVRPSTWVPTRGMLIPISVLQKVVGFDERFPQYGSDTDFCYRARRNGTKIYVSYDSVVYSDWRKTGPGSPFIKQSFIDFIRNVIFNKYSSRYLGNNFRIIWRHFNKFLFPFLALKVIFAKISSYRKYQRKDA